MNGGRLPPLAGVQTHPIFAVFHQKSQASICAGAPVAHPLTAFRPNLDQHAGDRCIGHIVHHPHRQTGGPGRSGRPRRRRDPGWLRAFRRRDNSRSGGDRNRGLSRDRRLGRCPFKIVRDARRLVCPLQTATLLGPQGSTDINEGPLRDPPGTRQDAHGQYTDNQNQDGEFNQSLTTGRLFSMLGRLHGLPPDEGSPTGPVCIMRQASSPC